MGTKNLFLVVILKENFTVFENKNNEINHIVDYASLSTFVKMLYSPPRTIII
jgi:hypothetical protein